MNRSHIHRAAGCGIACVGLSLASAPAQQRVQVDRSAARTLARAHTLPANFGSLQPGRTLGIGGGVDEMRGELSADQQLVLPGSLTRPAGLTPHTQLTEPADYTLPAQLTPPTRFPQDRGAVRVETPREGQVMAHGHGGVIRTAQGDVVMRDRTGKPTVLPDIDDSYRSVNVGGADYFYRDYRYYWPYTYGGSVYYQEVYPPAGARESELPDGSTLVASGDEQYYLADDVYYEHKGDEYVVVDVPESAAEPAQRGPPPPEPREPMALLKAMTEHLGTVDACTFSTTEFYDDPQEGGQLKPMMPQRKISLRRPDRLAVERRDGFDQRRFYYDGKTATLLDESKKVYSQVDAPDTLARLLELLRNDYGMTVPLADFLRLDFAERVEPLLTVAEYDGWEEVVGHRCHRLVLITAEVDGKVWIDANSEAPLLRRVELKYVMHPGQPEYVATINQWNLGATLPDRTFQFSPPSGAKEIAMVPAAAN